MSAPVDVLAVMDCATKELRDQRSVEHRVPNTLEEARDAVDELIEADKEYDAAIAGPASVFPTPKERKRIRMAEARRAAALVRMEPQS